jgi:hypothetical protein
MRLTTVTWWVLAGIICLQPGSSRVADAAAGEPPPPAPAKGATLTVDQILLKLKAGTFKLKEADVRDLLGPPEGLKRQAGLADLQMNWAYATNIYATFKDGKLSELTGAFSERLPIEHVTPANFKRLRLGMTEQQVVAVLGQGNGTSRVGDTVTRTWGRYCRLRVSLRKDGRMFEWREESENAVYLPPGLDIPGLPAFSTPVRPLKDFTNIKLEDYQIKPVKPRKDSKTGFIVGGKNATSLIKGLTEINGKTIVELEKVMRPGAASRAGFLGKDEKLLDILAADNQYVVDKLGLTHQELAKHLFAMWAVHLSEKQSEVDLLYRGVRFKVKVLYTIGSQESPFADGTSSGAMVWLENLNNRKKLTYAHLVPYMMERYGFYEGKGTSFRVDPRDVVDVFDLLRDRK